MKGTKPVQALRIVWEKTLTLALSLYGPGT